MPYCSILECKNDSRRKNLKNGGVSYHRFPNDPSVKEKWIDATGRINWMPSKLSTICSEHFLEEDFLISNKGYRYTKPTAFPSMKIVRFYNEPQNVKVACAGPSKRPMTLESYDSSASRQTESQPKKKTELHEDLVGTNNSVQFEGKPDVNIDPNYSTPRKKKLKGQLKYCENKIDKQRLKIKRLQSKNRRLKKKINNMDEILLRLEEKFAMAKENLDCLKNTNLEVL